MLEGRHALPVPAPAGRLPRLAAEPLASPTTSRRARRPPRRVRGLDPRRRRARRAATRRSTTTTARSWPRRSPTGSPRRSPSTCTSVRASTGATSTSRLSSEDLVAERYRGIRPGVRLPGLPRPLREGAAVRAARRRCGRDGADRDVRHAACRERQRPLFPPPGGPLLLRRPDRARPGRGLRRAERDRRSARRSGGSRRTSRTPPPYRQPVSARYPDRAERAPARRSLVFRHEDNAEERNRPFDVVERERPRDVLRRRSSRRSADTAAAAADDRRWACAWAASSSAAHRRSPCSSLGGAAGGAYLYCHQSVAAVAAHSKDVKLAAKHLDIPLPNQPAIALVVGYDKRHGDTDRGRSDTMMLLRADPTTKSISMLSFPRDLITNLYCGNRIVATDRINGAYAICGSKGALDTVKHLTGLPINYLVTVDFNGFIEIVTASEASGWTSTGATSTRTSAPRATNFSNIDLQPGYQRLKGHDALAYVRYRHTDSDLYRLARQQQFVKAMKAADLESTSRSGRSRRSSARSRTTSRSATPAAARSRGRSSAMRSSRTACRRVTSSSRRSTTSQGYDTLECIASRRSPPRCTISRRPTSRRRGTRPPSRSAARRPASRRRRRATSRSAS